MQWTTDGRAGTPGYVARRGDLLLLTTSNGIVRVAAATPEDYRELSRYPATERQLWSAPAWLGDRLLLRAREELRLWATSPVAGK